MKSILFFFSILEFPMYMEHRLIAGVEPMLIIFNLHKSKMAAMSVL